MKKALALSILAVTLAAAVAITVVVNGSGGGRNSGQFSGQGIGVGNLNPSAAPTQDSGGVDVSTATTPGADDVDVSAIAIPTMASMNGGIDAAELYGGQNLDVGQVNVSYDNVTGYLTVEFALVSENWSLAETNIHVGATLGDIPQTKKGNPIPGKFDYSAEYVPADRIASDTLVIAVGQLEEGDSIYIAAHAEIVQLDADGQIIQEESAWGDGQDFEGANWATCIVFKYEQELASPQVGTGATTGREGPWRPLFLL